MGLGVWAGCRIGVGVGVGVGVGFGVGVGVEVRRNVELHAMERRDRCCFLFEFYVRMLKLPHCKRVGCIQSTSFHVREGFDNNGGLHFRRSWRRLPFRPRTPRRRSSA